jgi:hypothetical protein
MLIVIVILIFVIGYLGIAFEYKEKLNKAVTALFTGVLCLLIFFITSQHTL